MKPDACKHCLFNSNPSQRRYVCMLTTHTHSHTHTPLMQIICRLAPWWPDDCAHHSQTNYDHTHWVLQAVDLGVGCPQQQDNINLKSNLLQLDRHTVMKPGFVFVLYVYLLLKSCLVILIATFPFIV